MELVHGCCIWLAIALTASGSSVHIAGADGPGEFHSTSFGGSSFYEVNGDNMSGLRTYNGAAISVTNDNGKVQININGKPVDLSQATVLEDNAEQIVYEPEGIPGAKITILKANKEIRVDYGGAHYRSLSPEQASAEVSKSMWGMQNELNRMNKQLNRLFSSFPFNSGMPRHVFG